MEAATLQARMTNPAFAVPDAAPALMGLGKALQASGLPPKTVELANIRASQINGCGVCVFQHPRIAKRHGETDERIWAIAGWRDAPFFDQAERAALALAEAMTRLSDRSDPVSDAIWEEAARHYDEQQLGALVLSIAAVNLWNRINVATRQVAGVEW
jgi:AhpD family alkylhydroperoxidase